MYIAISRPLLLCPKYTSGVPYFYGTVPCAFETACSNIIMQQNMYTREAASYTHAWDCLVRVWNSPVLHGISGPTHVHVPQRLSYRRVDRLSHMNMGLFYEHETVHMCIGQPLWCMYTGPLMPCNIGQSHTESPLGI